MSGSPPPPPLPPTGVYFYLTTQYNLILLLRATKLVPQHKNILNYTLVTKYDMNAKLQNTQPTKYPT